MFAPDAWDDDKSFQAPQPSKSRLEPGELPRHVAAALWRGNDLGSSVNEVVRTGWAHLDQALPGGGWPLGTVIEVLQPQALVCEWRLVGPALSQLVAAQKPILIIGPARPPHLPGLRQAGLDDRYIIWIQVESPAHRLFVTEQIIASNFGGAVLAWLPQARADQIRRLQVRAQSGQSLAFLFRPTAAAHEASAAPLRIQLGFGLDWELHLHILKRKGATHEGLLRLRSVPSGLESILTPRLLRPSALIASRTENESNVPSYVVGRPAPAAAPRRRIAAH